MVQPPYVERAKIQETSEALLIKIPPRKNNVVLFLAAFWLCMVGFVLFMFSTLAASLITTFASSIAIRLGLLVYTVVLMALLSFMVYTLSRILFGTEILEVSDGSISVGLQIFGVERGRSFDHKHIGHLRTTPTVGERKSQRRWFSSLAFDYAARTIRFGGGIADAEAQQILERIQKKFPQYAPNESTA